MNFGQYLFGTIGGSSGGIGHTNSNISFIPKDSHGGTFNIKGANAQWWGLRSRDMQKKAYESCFPVASVIDRLAEYDIAGEIEILRSEGKGKENLATSPWAKNMNRLFEQPNPLQTWDQFRGQQVVYKKVFGFCPVLPFVPFGLTPDNALSMINLPPWLFDVVGTDDLIHTYKIEDIVKKYKVSILGKSFELEAKEVIILEDSFMQDDQHGFLLPQSRMIGLDMAVSNICAAMEADNVLLRKKGPLGFLSPEAQKDAAGYIPFDPKDKRELQDALLQYGMMLSQDQYVISNGPTKWNPMSYNVNDLGTKDTVTAGEKAVCHRYGFPYTLYEQQDATYSNGLNAEKGLYQSNIIPNNWKDLKKYEKFFKASENNCKIVSDYSGIACLQEDELSRAQAANAWNAALQVEYDNNLITKNQWLVGRGYDSIPDGDVYKTSSQITLGSSDPIGTPIDIEAEAKANLKGSVGGVQGLIQIQTSVSQGITDYEAALTMLFEIYGFSEETAKKLLGTPKATKPEPKPNY